MSLGETLMTYWPAILALVGLGAGLVRLEWRVRQVEKDREEDKVQREKEREIDRQYHDKNREADRAYFTEKIGELRIAVQEQTREVRSTIEQRHSDMRERMVSTERNLIDRIDIFTRLTSIDQKMKPGGGGTREGRD